MRTLRDASALAEHQLEAVERLERVLESAGGALLADEPGLGKSFIAAEVARRCREPVEIIVPVSLAAQWAETLRTFAVDARITTHDALARDSFVPPPSARMLVVDEAHAFRNPQTQRYAALARRSAGARLLLVTATPICNSARDLHALLRLAVADDALTRSGVPSIDLAFESLDRAQLRTVMRELVIRRGREVLPPRLRFGELRETVIRTEVPALAIDALQFPLVGAHAMLRQFLWRRLESSEAAFLESIRRQRRFYERALECLAAGRALPKRDYRRAFAHEEDAHAFQTVLFWEMFVPQAMAADADAIHDEVTRLDRLREEAERSPRTKLKRLVEICERTGEPLIVFTGWAATAEELHRAIAPVRRCALVTGRGRTRAASAIDAFTRGKVDVLVSTDLAAEGLNLQRAGTVIHYDLPWNPVKVEQRNGRAHRIGQQRPEVHSIVFVSSEDRATVVEKVTAKNRVRRQVLDLSAEDARAAVAVTLRPRVAADAAVVAFTRAVERAGWTLPSALGRRHKAGFEALLLGLASERIDERKLRDLEELASLEPWGRSPAPRFTPI